MLGVYVASGFSISFYDDCFSWVTTVDLLDDGTFGVRVEIVEIFLDASGVLVGAVAEDAEYADHLRADGL